MRWSLAILLLVPCVTGTPMAGHDFQSMQVSNTSAENATLVATYSDVDQVLRVTHVDGATATMNITLIALLEFRDLDDDGRYSLGDALEQRWTIDSLARPQVTSSASDPAKASVTYRIPSAWNSKLEIGLSADAATPGRIDMVWRIMDIDFKTGNHTYVALEVRIDGPVDIHGHGVRHPVQTEALQWAWTGAMENRTTLVKFAAAQRQGAAVYFAQPASFEAVMESHWRLSSLPPEQEPPSPLLRIIGQWPAFLVGLLFAAVVVVGGARLSGGPR